MQQKLRAVIHYITAETDLRSDGYEASRCVSPSAEVETVAFLHALAQERDLQDLERSLTSLWIHYNKGQTLRVREVRLEQAILCHRT